MPKIAKKINNQAVSAPNEECARRILPWYEASGAYSVKACTMDETPRVVRTEEIYKGRIFTVRVDTLAVDGKEQRFEIVEHPGSVAIAALPGPQSIVLITQYRHAAGETLWEIPAGTAQSGESFQEGARRELAEETGYQADRFELLCDLYPTPGYCTERVRLFAARGLHGGTQSLEEDERIDVREVSFQEAAQMQASGQIRDMKTMLALLWLAGWAPGRR